MSVGNKIFERNSLSDFKLSVRANEGFSLLEITMALTILGILLFNVVNHVTVFRDYKDYKDNRLVMQEIRNALLVFAQSNGHLPCPDTSGNGVENRSDSGGQTGVCDAKSGFLPYQMLGVQSIDEWGQPFYYAINSQADASGTIYINDETRSASYFSVDTSTGALPKFTLTTPPIGTGGGGGNFDICSEVETSGCNGSTADDNKIELAAILVVVSFGKNGGQTWPLVGTASVNTLSTFEEENADNDNYFWQALPSNQAVSGYDDQMVWLSAMELKYAMINAGQALE